MHLLVFEQWLFVNMIFPYVIIKFIVINDDAWVHWAREIVYILASKVVFCVGKFFLMQPIKDEMQIKWGLELNHTLSSLWISRSVVHWLYTLGLAKISWWQLGYCIKFHIFALPWEAIPEVFPTLKPSLIYISRPLHEKRKDNKGISIRCILGVNVLWKSATATDKIILLQVRL